MRDPAFIYCFPRWLLRTAISMQCFRFLELRGCSTFLFLTVPILDKRQEGRGAKFINFGNQVFRRETSGAIRPAILCCIAGSRERRQRQECFHEGYAIPRSNDLCRLRSPSPKQEHNSATQ